MSEQPETKPRFIPGLLPETAEIAMGLLRQVIEERLTADLHLRRLSAPLCLPADSKLNDYSSDALTFTTEIRDNSGKKEVKMEVVTGLDHWLRAQLKKYDVAPEYGVYTDMHALRPWMPETTTSSPQVTAWAWQKVLGEFDTAESDVVKETAREVYSLLREAEKAIVEKFPHMQPILPEELTAIAEHTERFPFETELDRREWVCEYLKAHPDCACLVQDVLGPEALAPKLLSAHIYVWNSQANCELELVEISHFFPDSDNQIETVGGNIWRDRLAMHLFRSPSIFPTPNP